MPTFTHPALLWGLLIAGVPVLIHLINMFRHRRVAWAAMEFLLVSQRRNRTWVLLKQLLLLLMRMVAVAAVVLMLAQPRLPTQWGRYLDSRRVHHIILLDDSYSMTDRHGGVSAFERAKAAAQRIGLEASNSPRTQSFTLIRFSEATDTARGKADLLDETVAGDFSKRLSDRLKDLSASETAAGPLPALEAVDGWLGDNPGEQRIVYLLTDFRTRHWNEPADLLPVLERLTRSRTALRLVQCVDRYQPNAAISSLEVGKSIRAAGVPFFLDVAVSNHSDSPLDDVVVQIEADGHARPALRIPRVPARQTVRDRVSLQFGSSGEYVVKAELDSDAVAVDNRRRAVIDVPGDLPVLLIDGDMDAVDATYLSSALRPGGTVATGLAPQIEKVRYLSQNPLHSFPVIFLLDVERLEDSAIKTLEEYVAGGGGLGVFLGPRCSSSFFNENLYRGGEGFFPVPLVGQETLFVDRLEKAPDLEVTDHPIFRVFAGQRNSFLSTVSVSRYFATVDPLPESIASSVGVIARLRNGAPLVVERPFGKGRVVAFLTTAGPEWNNWARGNPSYVVTVLELLAYLGRAGETTESKLVGDDLEIDFDAAAFSPQVRWLPPTGHDLKPATSEGVLQDDGSFLARFAKAPISGIYRAELSGKSGDRRTRHVAVNVDPAEGNLDLVDGPTLAARLEGLDYQYEAVDAFRYEEHEAAGTELTDILLCVLLALLVVEQLFAYWVSDHPPRTAAAGGAS
ncbi:MAG: VWA domain-containing protein [Planctomycetaceae bacterium]|nr:VWA domain-containing protein [Planctomycetaceae bacterium]